MKCGGVDSAEDLIKVKILPNENKYFQVGKSMSQEELLAVLLTLIHNLDVFSWSPYEVPRVDPKFITRKLNMDLLFLPNKHKPRRSAKQHVEAVKEEVAKLK